MEHSDSDFCSHGSGKSRPSLFLSSIFSYIKKQNKNGYFIAILTILHNQQSLISLKLLIHIPSWWTVLIYIKLDWKQDAITLPSRSIFSHTTTSFSFGILAESHIRMITKYTTNVFQIHNGQTATAQQQVCRWWSGQQSLSKYNTVTVLCTPIAINCERTFFIHVYPHPCSQKVAPFHSKLL